MFKEYFFRIPLLSAEELYNGNQNINDEIVKHINDALIKKILNFNNQKKVKGRSRMLPSCPSDLHQ